MQQKLRGARNVITALADEIFARMPPDFPTILVGPLVWQPEPKHPDGKDWYFTLAMFDTAAGHVAWDAIHIGPDISAKQIREGVYFALLQRRPLVLHDFDDELDMARCCEGIWPGERITAIRKDIERERAEWAATK